MVNIVATKSHLKIANFLLSTLGICVLIQSLLSANSSFLIKYGSALFLIVEKLLAIKRVMSNPNLEYLLDQIFQFDIQMFNKNYRKIVSFNWIYNVSTLFITLLEYNYFENEQYLYKVFIFSCLFTISLFIYQDWVAALDFVIVIYIVLSMNSLYIQRFNFREVAITISCYLVMILFGFIACFDSKDNKGALNLKEVAIGLFLSMSFGITLPFNANKKEFILRNYLFKVLGQTSGFFSLNVLVTFKNLFFHYSLVNRVLIIMYIPIFLYRLYRQFNFFINGPYYTSLEIDCNSYNKLFRQINDEVHICKIIFQHFSANWACDQMDFLHKINKNTLFTYELHHGALVSQIQYENHMGNDVLSVDSNNLSVLIFALYVYTLNQSFSNLRLYFDFIKYKQIPQYQLDFYLIRYPFVSFYSKQFDYHGREIPFQVSPLVRTYKKDVQNQVLSLIIFERDLKNKISQFRYDIFCDLNQ